MALDRRARLLSAAALTLWLLCGTSGCAVLHDLGFRPGDASRVIAHHNYMPRHANVCFFDPVFFGYHATCWSPWPEGWSGCPPPYPPGDDSRSAPEQAPPPSEPRLAPVDPSSQQPGLPASPAAGSPFHQEETSAAPKDRAQPVVQTSTSLLEAAGSRPAAASTRRQAAPRVTRASWLVSVTDEPAEPIQSDWLLSVHDERP